MTFTAKDKPTAKASMALNNAIAAVKKNITKMQGRYPRIGEDSGIAYEYCAGDDWVEGFWPGQLWLSYQVSNDATFKDAGTAMRAYFTARHSRAKGHIHDFGFMYSLSAVADYKLTGNEAMADVAVEAAEVLRQRFNPKGQYIQAWNENERALAKQYSNRGKMIVDCMENLALLFWATDYTGRQDFADVAIAHANTTEKYLVRDDYSTAHTFNFNPDTGAPLVATTAQGFKDDSCWSRGQAWAVHGYSYMYKNTGDKHYLELAQKLADYALNRLPANGMPVWDFDLTEDYTPYPDSSAAAIFAAGFLLLDQYVQTDKYAQMAGVILDTLNNDYSVTQVEAAEGLIIHGASHVLNGRSDNMLPYGDYFYLEALMRRDGFTNFFW